MLKISYTYELDIASFKFGHLQNFRGRHSAVLYLGHRQECVAVPRARYVAVQALIPGTITYTIFHLKCQSEKHRDLTLKIKHSKCILFCVNANKNGR